MMQSSRFRFTLAALTTALLLSTAPGAFARGGGSDDGGGSGGGGGNGGGNGGGDKSLVLRVNPAIGAPGGTVAVVLRTYAPRPVRQGQIVVRVARRPKPAKGLGLTLEDLTAPVRPLTFLSATVYSPKNDALAQGLLNGLADSQLAEVTFQSPSGSVNSADGPLAVFLFRLDPSVQPGDTFDLTLDPVQTGLTDAAGAPVTLAPRSDVLTVRAPKDPFKLEADGDKVQPGAVAELGVNTFEPFGVSGGRITLTWDARLSGGAPAVKLDPRYGKSTFTVDSSKPGRLVVDFKSPDSSFNSIPGTIVAISLPISPSASIGASSPFTLDPAGTYLLTRKGRKVRLALQNGTLSIQ
ncbi:MAG TPA: hypothetical protein VIJ36_10285 [Thermoanaerobaculia bacterium]